MGRKRSGVVLALVLGAGCVADVSAQEHCEHLGAQAVAAERQGRPFWFRTYEKRRLIALVLAECAYRPEADRALNALIDDRRFKRLSAEDRRSTLSAAAANAWRLEQTQRALELYRRAVAADPGNADDWYRLSILERAAGDDTAATTALIHLVEHWPDVLDNLDDQYIFSLIFRLESRTQLRLDLLQALYDANWRRKEQGASAAWYELAVMRIERGEADAARAAIRRVDTPKELVKLRADKRFDAIVDRDAGAFDVGNAAAQEVERYRSLSELQPDSLDLNVQLGYALLTADRAKAALAHTDKVLARIADAPADQSPYKDPGDASWVINNRAIALRRLGRLPEALSELRRAADLAEGGQVNVSQALNLGDFYASLQRPDQALAAAARAGSDISGYGRMIQVSVQLRAALQQHDADGAERALTYLREHRKDGEHVYLDALLVSERLDEAQSALLELLASPENRGDALEWLQVFRQAEPLPGDRAWRARKAELVARKPVQEAIARVGRIERYAIYGANEMQ